MMLTLPVGGIAGPQRFWQITWDVDGSTPLCRTKWFVQPADFFSSLGLSATMSVELWKEKFAKRDPLAGNHVVVYSQVKAALSQEPQAIFKSSTIYNPGLYMNTKLSGQFLRTKKDNDKMVSCVGLEEIGVIMLLVVEEASALSGFPPKPQTAP